ncbi:hypothetical protein SVAN01_04124 [Stagonosporopsis vannaccii]|nr:hypothetical protein SVAN01_04124 [Stagonosporopsis vannaccii]
MQASTAGGYTGCIIAVFVHHSVSRAPGVLVRGKWWGHARAANGPGACGLPSVTTAAILFHETPTRIAEQHIARLATRSSPSCLVVFPLSRPVMQMQVQQGSALRSIDYYNPHAPCSTRILVWPAKVSILAPWSRRISVESCALTIKGAAALPPHYTFLVDRWLFLGTAASRASGTEVKQALRYMHLTLVPTLTGQLCDLLALSDSAWRRGRVVIG